MSGQVLVTFHVCLSYMTSNMNHSSHRLVYVVQKYRLIPEITSEGMFVLIVELPRDLNDCL